MNMLARQYQYGSNATEQWQEEVEVKQPRVRTSTPKSHNRLARRRFLVVIALILAMYCIAVLRSATLIKSGDELITLKQSEAQLMTKNAELKIEVEELKGPERITSIAEKQLGMSVAQSNIYVKAGKDSGNNSTYALAH